MGAEIVGVSVDSHFALRSFAKKLSLRFPLVSDFNRTVIGDWVGYYDDVIGYRGVGKRSVFVVDSSAVVTWRWIASEVSEVPDTEMVREAVQDVAYP